MREICTSGSVGAPPGNRRGYPTRARRSLVGEEEVASETSKAIRGESPPAEGEVNRRKRVLPPQP